MLSDESSNNHYFLTIDLFLISQSSIDLLLTEVLDQVSLKFYAPHQLRRNMNERRYKLLVLLIRFYFYKIILRHNVSQQHSILRQ